MGAISDFDPGVLHERATSRVVLDAFTVNSRFTSR